MKYFFLSCVSFIIFYSCTIKESQIIDHNGSELLETYISNAKNKEKGIHFRLENANKAYALVKDMDDNIQKRKKLNSLSLAYLNLNRKDKYIEIIEESIILSKKIFDSAGIAFNYNNYAILYKGLNRLDSAYAFHKRAEEIYSNLNIKKHYEHGKALLGIAIIHRQIKDYPNSISSTIEAIKYFELDGKANNYLTISYSNLGIVCNRLEEFDESINYHKKSIEYAKALKNRIEREVLAYNNIGIVFKNQKRYKEAISYFKKALLYKDYLNKNPKNRARLLDNIGYIKFLSNKNDTTALDLFNKAYKIRDSINDVQNISTSNLHYAEYYKVLGNDSLAISYALKVEDASSIANDNDELLRSYQILSKVLDSKKGLVYAQKYIKLNDSLTRQERLHRDKFARIRFETDQKEQHIIEVQNKNTIYLLGILLLLTIISFAFFFFRQRTKYLAQQNKIIQFQASYDTETRISKRLHDELGNDIFQMMLQYQHNPQDPTIPEKLNTTYHKARDISRENSEFDTDASYPQELTNMLQNYTQNEVQFILRGLDKMEWNNIGRNIKITVYRVLQELMTNMQKHSQATLVALVFNYTENQLTIKYSDNGVGMNQIDQKSSNGLRNTEKRIQAINGTLIFTTEKDKGFKAEMRIPC